MVRGAFRRVFPPECWVTIIILTFVLTGPTSGARPNIFEGVFSSMLSAGIICEGSFRGWKNTPLGGGRNEELGIRS